MNAEGVTDATTPTQTTADRLEAAHAEKAELRLIADMHEAGFESVEDYHAWKQLEELRKITKELRGKPAGQRVHLSFDPGNAGIARADLFPLAG